jgi:signal transduction histidine kinase
MGKINSAQLMQDASGPWFGYLPPLLLLAPVWIAISIFQLSESARQVMLFQAILANIGALSVCALVLWGFRKLNLLLFFHVSSRATRLTVFRFWAAVVAGAVVGFLKAVGTSAFLAAFTSNPAVWNALAQRITSNVLVGMWTIPAFAIILSTLERYRREKHALISELVAQSLRSSLTKQGNDGGEYENSKYLSRLVQLRTELAKRVAEAPPDSRSISKIFSELASGGVRSLSHDIWREENRRFTNFTLLDLARVALSRNKYPVIAIMLAWTAVVTPVLLLNFAAGSVLIQVGSQVFLIGAVYTLMNRIRTTSLLGGVVSFLVSTLLTTWLMLVTSFILPPALDELANLVIILSFFACVPLTFAMTVTAHKDSESIEAELSFLMGEKELERIEKGSHVLHERHLAHYLHGHVQSHLMATSLRLSQHNTSLDPEEIQRELKAIDHLLADAYSASEKNSRNTLNMDEIRHRIISEWSGLAEITVTVSLHDTKSEDASEHYSANELDIISHVLSEGISNAVRHGMATHIRCTLTPDSIIIIDNGTGPRNGKAGLGSIYFTSLCEDEPWQLEALPEGGARLSVPLPRDVYPH